jgi:hypothetical protein
MSLHWFSCAFLCVVTVSSMPCVNTCQSEGSMRPPLASNVVVCIRYRYSEKGIIRASDLRTQLAPADSDGMFLR